MPTPHPKGPWDCIKEQERNFAVPMHVHISANVISSLISQTRKQSILMSPKRELPPFGVWLGN